jgi:hypothetical protein
MTWDEEQEYKRGKEDEGLRRSDYNHDRYANDGIDKAYWDGREDKKKEMREEQTRREEKDREEQEQERWYRERSLYE